MYGITDLRKDTMIELDGVPFRVLEYSQTQMGRGGSTVKTKLKNLLTGNVLDRTFKNDEKVAPASIEQKTVQYLYANGSRVALMDMVSFDQEEVNSDIAGEVVKYFPEGAEIRALFFKGKIIGFDLPKNTPIKVTSAPGGAKGDTATGATKAVELETGIEIQVPLFIKTGDTVKVDTRTGQYLERVK